MSAAIKISNLSKKFNLPLKPPGGISSYLPARKIVEDFWALQGINLEVPGGKMLGIVGLNGSGKSTLLRIIAGILPPTTGEVSANGRVAALLELGAGFHEELTGMENIFLNGAILGFSRREILNLIPGIIEFSGLGEFIDTPIKHYSSGMQARLGFSVAVNVNPDILLIDEIISVGDMEFQSKCFERIADFRRRGKTILFVTHEIDVANYLCDDLLWLEKGRVRSFGEAGRVANEYRAEIYGKTIGHTLQSTIRNPQSAIRNLQSAHHGVSTTARLRPSTIRNSIIQGVRFLDARGESQTAFSTNEPMTIEITYNTGTCPLEHPGINIIITREDNVIIADIHSTESGFMPDRLEGAGKILVYFRPLLLLFSKYDVSIRIYDSRNPQHIYDQKLREYEFRVTTLRTHNLGIVAELPCEWTIADEA